MALQIPDRDLITKTYCQDGYHKGQLGKAGKEISLEEKQAKLQTNRVI